ncbi:hypothetical protein GGD40_003292 [Paraburkholderia bryophila]|uniref:Uncharacterized protein n=1 Tax=Paraburkholderia bryophila TaxID=420952 RepID=A0A7Y9WQ10_9BURK|nr:hypothetical protein [Paraburkholderia bryophila]
MLTPRSMSGLTSRLAADALMPPRRPASADSALFVHTTCP